MLSSTRLLASELSSYKSKSKNKNRKKSEFHKIVLVSQSQICLVDKREAKNAFWKYCFKNSST